MLRLAPPSPAAAVVAPGAAAGRAGRAVRRRASRGGRWSCARAGGREAEGVDPEALTRARDEEKKLLCPYRYVSLG